MKIFGEIRVAVVVALFLVLSVGLVQAHTTTTVLVGTVLQVIHTGDDLFVKLDTNNDGSSDAMLKLSLTDTVTTARGQKIQASDVAEGMIISKTSTKDSSGYYEPFESNVSATASQSALSGTVIRVRQLGDTVFADVDTDRDGVADIQVKLEGRDTVLDENGDPVALGSLAAGSQITIPAYRYDSQNDEFDAKETSESSDSSVNDSNDNATDNSNDSSGDHNEGNDASSDQGQDDNGNNDSNDHGQDRNDHSSSNDNNDGNDNNDDDNNDDND